MKTFHLVITRNCENKSYRIDVFSLKNGERCQIFEIHGKNPGSFFHDLNLAITRLKDATEYGSA